MEFGILIDFDNLDAWTRNYAKAFRPCFTKEYTMKYMTKFAKDRFQNLLDQADIQLKEKEFKTKEKLFVSTFIDEMVDLIDKK